MRQRFAYLYLCRTLGFLGGKIGGVRWYQGVGRDGRGLREGVGMGWGGMGMRG